MDEKPEEFRQRGPESIDRVLASIRAVWVKHPTWRFGQLIASAVNPPDLCPKLFGMGDDRLVQHVEEFGRSLDNPPPATP
jgi:hypothetical protein